MFLCAVQDFKECLDDLEQQVADFTDEVQQLAQYTSESISFEVRRASSTQALHVGRTHGRGIVCMAVGNYQLSHQLMQGCAH